MPDKKTLYLVRHGKSSWGYENVSDMDRPLKNRGIRDAYEMSSRLINRGVLPDLMISSPAIRALHSCVIFASELKYPFNRIRIEEILYFSEESMIMNFIREISDAVSTMLVFGHNPIISNIANMFFKNQVEYIPTTGIAKFIFKTNSWSKISKQNLIEEWYDTPKKS